jgi:GntR family transcriptional regulator, transcriptional repressor for pyruvate dehydrogenase complex
VLDMRAAVEVGVATVAADRIGDDALHAMREAVDRMEAATEFEEYRRADVRFHIAIAEATGVPRLVELATEVQAEVTELIAHIAHPPQVLRHSNADHIRLIEALGRHDAARAVRVLRKHLTGTEHILSGLMPGGPLPE